MKINNFYYLLLIFLINIQSCGQSSKNKILYSQEVTNEKAIQTLKEFYTLYISAYSSSDENNTSDSIKNKYLTVRLLNKLKNPNLELDADPLLNAQDCDKNCIKTLEIKPESGEKNVYTVCYTWLSDNKKICILLLLEEVNGNYLIDDILNNQELHNSKKN
jgi:hypothetical protein